MEKQTMTNNPTVSNTLIEQKSKQLEELIQKQQELEYQLNQVTQAVIYTKGQVDLLKELSKADTAVKD